MSVGMEAVEPVSAPSSRLLHLRLVSLYSMRNSLRSGTGIVYVVLTVTFGLTMANLVISPIEQGIGLESFQDGTEEVLDFGLGLLSLKAIGDVSEEAARALEYQHWAAFLVRERPMLLSAILLLLAICLPLLVATGAFNQLSGDIQYHGLRYQLLRTSRASLFFGRYMGNAIFSIVVMVALVLAVVLYLGIKLDIYSWGDLLPWGGRGLLALVILCLPYVALCLMISSFVDSPFGSLVICGIVIPAVPAVALAGMNAWEPLGYLIHLLPWGVHHQFLHPKMSHVAGAAAACIGYTAVFLSLGYWNFSRRDL
ncbi:MAG: ABC transporter permease subunit [Planctomycetota bacterium]